MPREALTRATPRSSRRPRSATSTAMASSISSSAATATSALAPRPCTGRPDRAPPIGSSPSTTRATPAIRIRARAKRSSTRMRSSPTWARRCTYPQRCMKQGFTVVREHDVYQGAGRRDERPAGTAAPLHLRRSALRRARARVPRVWHGPGVGRGARRGDDDHLRQRHLGRQRPSPGLPGRAQAEDRSSGCSDGWEWAGDAQERAPLQDGVHLRARPSEPGRDVLRSPVDVGLAGVGGGRRPSITAMRRGSISPGSTASRRRRPCGSARARRTTTITATRSTPRWRRCTACDRARCRPTPTTRSTG